MNKFDPSKYDMVENRIRQFWEKHPNGSIMTEVLYNFTKDVSQVEDWHEERTEDHCVKIEKDGRRTEYVPKEGDSKDDGQWVSVHTTKRKNTSQDTQYSAAIIIQATLLDENRKVIATGIAEERQGDGYVNNDWHVENCETSAIGRALANMGLFGDKRPSLEEMNKGKRQNANHVTKELNAPKESSVETGVIKVIEHAALAGSIVPKAELLSLFQKLFHGNVNEGVDHIIENMEKYLQGKSIDDLKDIWSELNKLIKKHGG